MGGDELLIDYHSALQTLIAKRPDAFEIRSVDGHTAETYRRLLVWLA